MRKPVSKKPTPVQGQLFLTAALIVLLAFGLLALAIYINERPPSDLQNLSPGAQYIVEIEGGTQSKNKKLSSKDIERIFNNHILPLIQEMDRQNKQAADDAIRHFKREYQDFESGIESFVEDLVGLGSRFKTLKNTVADKVFPRDSSYNSQSRMQELMGEKFAYHIMSDRDLEALITETLDMYKDDVEANRNQMLSAIDLALREEDVPLGKVLQMKLGDNFRPYLYDQMIHKAIEKSQDSAVAGLIGLIAMEVVSLTATSAVTSFTSGLGTSAAGSTASALASQVLASGLGSLASFKVAASGGTLGTALGPIGTAGGLIVGAGVGLVVDIWLSGRFKEKATPELKAMMRSLETTLVQGKTGNFPNKGLRPLFNEANNTLFEISRTAVLETMNGAI